MIRPEIQFLAKQKVAFEAFRRALFDESDRGCALFAAAYLDGALAAMLQACVVKSAKMREELFKTNAPLASFSSRIKMAYYLGKLSPLERKDFETIRSIRNDFAHHPEFIDFEAQSVKDRCSNLAHVWHEPAARPRAKFTAAVTALLAMVHAETFKAKAPEQKKDDPISEEKKKEIRDQANEMVDKAIRHFFEKGDAKRDA